MNFRSNILMSVLMAFTLWFPLPSLALDPPKSVTELTSPKHKIFKQSQSLQQNSSVFNFEEVISGDSFIANGLPIKLWGIKGVPKGHNAYKAATLLLEALLKGKELTCQPLEGKSGEMVTMNCSADAIDINAMMVRMGMARDYPEESQGFFEQDEQEAVSQQRGMWSSELADTRMFLDDMEIGE